MSSPHTNIDKQQRRHRPALWGIWGGLGVVAVLFVVYLAFIAAQGNDPGDENEVREEIGAGALSEDQ